MRVGAINNAGYLASFETNGVVIDTSPPIVSIMTKSCLFCYIHYLISFERSLITKVLDLFKHSIVLDVYINV